MQRQQMCKEPTNDASAAGAVSPRIYRCPPAILNCMHLQQYIFKYLPPVL
jgi:hypothetical protein